MTRGRRKIRSKKEKKSINNKESRKKYVNQHNQKMHVIIYHKLQVKNKFYKKFVLYRQ